MAATTEPSDPEEDAFVPDNEFQHKTPRCGSLGLTARKASKPTATSTSTLDSAADGLAFEEMNARKSAESFYEQWIRPNSIPNEWLTSKITAFDDQREDEKMRMYRAVLRVAGRMWLLGTVGSAAGIAMSFFIPEHIVLYKGVRIIGFFILVLGVVAFSSCPLDLVDFNTMCKRNWKSITALCAALMLIALLQVKLFPHLDALKALVSAGGAIAAWPRTPAWWPYASTWVVFYFGTLAAGWGAVWLFPERNNLPEMVTWGYYLNAGMRLFYGPLMIAKWLRWRWLWEHAPAVDKGPKLKNHTAAVFQVMYEFFIGYGIDNMLQGIFPALRLQSGSSEAVEGVMNMIFGALCLSPAVVVLTVGRKRLFNFLGLHFDRDVARLRRDGAFVAELLDSIPVQVEQVWWVHREQPDERYPMEDPRRVWQQGLVINIHEEDSSDFEVQLPLQEQPWGRESLPQVVHAEDRSRRHSSKGAAPKDGPPEIDVSKFAGGPVLRLPLPSKGGAKSKEELLLQAQRGLRCVDFDRLTQELMYRVDSRNRPELQVAWYGLSRPVRSGEKIDYFMSNSWYDDPVRKWEKLQEVAERFQRRHGRSPTLWLDKVCIDQTAIADGLKVLPVNVMACEKLLCLCGDTYLSRLWCIWELFTLFSFASEVSATQKVEFVSLGTFEEGLDMLDSMANFHVKDAHCYDPNEEARLRHIIDAVGTIRFNKRISRLAQVTRARLEKRTSALGRTIWAASMGKSWSVKASTTSEEASFDDGMHYV